MPNKPKTICSHPGCYIPTESGKCEKHKHQARKERDKKRGTANQRGYTYEWQVASEAFLVQHPFCVLGLTHKKTKPTPATVVDHKKPHRGNMQLFWDVTNWQSACKPCHDYKTNVLGE